jgi:hypothetical protein
MKSTRTALLPILILLASCADCADSEPPAKIEDICPAQPLPPEDCYVTDDKNEQNFNIRKVKDFQPICNSPCTKAKEILIQLEEKLDKPMPMGNIKHIRSAALSDTSYSQKFEGLNKIEEITNLDITNTKLEYLPNLESIKSITQLNISDNNNLLGTTKPLLVEESTTVGGQLNISNNPKLKDLKLLSNLKRAHYIVLLGNGDQSFETLEGLNNLEEIESLIITGNRNLKSLRALSKLKKVTNLLIIENHGKLPQYEIDWLLGNLEVVTDDVRIANNSSVAPDCAE